MISAEMLFGRKIGDRVGVSEADFAAFAAREITPRFPDGLTIIDARGQYRDAGRERLIREPSKLVLITFRQRSAEARRARRDRRSLQDGVQATVGADDGAGNLRELLIATFQSGFALVPRQRA